MSNIFDMRETCPSVMTILRAGEGIAAAPEGVSSGPFLVQMILSSRAESEMTAMRAFVPPGVVTHWHSHPRGQLLFVLDGVGLVQREGREATQVRAGDAVWVDEKTAATLLLRDANGVRPGRLAGANYLRSPAMTTEIHVRRGE